MARDSSDSLDDSTEDALLVSDSNQSLWKHDLRHQRRARFHLDTSISKAWNYIYRAPALTSRIASPLRIILVLSIVLSLILSFLLGSAFHAWSTARPVQQCRANVGKWNPVSPPLLRNGTTLEKPENIKIVATIFYGRRVFVDILDCYLRRNLAINGGFLDEVHFLLHSTNPKDDRWLRHMIKRDNMEKHYKILQDERIEKMEKWRGFPELWGKFMVDPDTIYIKIDDDTVFIDDAAIPRMVYTLLAHPEAHSVQANVVNNMRTHWYHLRSGAILPYLPDTSAPAPCCNTSWRASDLPCFRGDTPSDWAVYGKRFKPPFKPHRWLPLEPTPQNLMRTPIAGRLPSPAESKGHDINWATEAQLHYSLLHNLENNMLGRYDFGNDEGTWNLWFKKYNINFMAVKGSTINQRPIWGKWFRRDWGDEKGLVSYTAAELEMPVLVDTRAVVSHFSFKFYVKNLMKSDVLSRYRAYANERICAPRNLKRSFGDTTEDEAASWMPVDGSDDGSDLMDTSDDQSAVQIGKKLAS